MRGFKRSNRRKRARERVARAEARKRENWARLARVLCEPIKAVIDYEGWLREACRALGIVTVSDDAKESYVVTMHGDDTSSSPPTC